MAEETEDLAALLNKATETPFNATVDIDDETRQRIADKIPIFESSDNEEKLIEEEESIITDAQVVEDETKVTEEQRAGFRKSARRYIGAFNLFNKLTLPAVYKNKILKPGDKELITQYRKQKDLNKNLDLEEAVASDDKLYQAIKRHEQLHDYIQGIALTKAERQELEEPLAECIEKYKWMRMGPEGQLLMSVFLIMAPRLEPLFPHLKGFFERILTSDDLEQE